MLDIILVPAEDETLYAQPLDGEPAYYYGLVGDALREIAEEGEFEWNAIVVRPTNKDDVYNGSWDKWMMDWTQRADMIAAWMYDVPWRRDMGIDFPYSFYELSPVLLVRETDGVRRRRRQPVWDRLTFIFKPFDAYLWLALVIAFLIVGILDAFNDGRYHDFGQPGLGGQLAVGDVVRLLLGAHVVHRARPRLRRRDRRQGPRGLDAEDLLGHIHVAAPRGVHGVARAPAARPSCSSCSRSSRPTRSTCSSRSSRPCACAPAPR